MSQDPKKSVSAEIDKPLIELEPIQKRMLTLALLAGLFLILFFNSAVKAVGSNITSDLGDASLFGFMNTIFFVGSTSMMPISTKIGDKYGRKGIISFGIALYTVSLLVAGTTHSMIIHLVARCTQGIGQGCMLANSLAFLGEINSSKERGRALGMYSVITGITNIIGPLAGGAITDALNWRWTCWPAVPVGIFVFLLVIRYMPKRAIRPDTKIDFAGAISIVVSVASIVFYTSFGQRYGFTSSFGIVCIVLFVAGIVVLSVSEKKAASPCIDFALFKNKSFAVTVIAVACLAPAMYGTGSYLANYAMAVKGLAATWSSSLVSLNSVGLLATGAVYTWITTHVDIKKICVFDAILFIINMGLMIVLDTMTPLWFIIMTALIQGARTSIYMPAFTTSLQNDMPPQQTGTATSTVQFIQGLVGTIGISCLGMMLNNRFAHNLAAGVIPEGLTNFMSQEDLSKYMTSTYLMSNKAQEVADFKATLATEAQPLFDQLMVNVREAYAGGLSFAYTIILVLCVGGLICCILMNAWNPNRGKKN